MTDTETPIFSYPTEFALELGSDQPAADYSLSGPLTMLVCSAVIGSDQNTFVIQSGHAVLFQVGGNDSRLLTSRQP